MTTFLQILLAVFLVIALLIGVAFFWLKWKLKGAIGQFSKASLLLGDMEFLPARIQLRRGDPDVYSKDFERLADQIRKLGFQRIADLEDHGGAYQSFMAAGHKEFPLAAAVTEDFSGNVAFVLFSMDKDRQLVGRGSNTALGISTPRVDWQMDADTSPETAFAGIREALTERSLRFDLKLFRAVFEQVYALRMDQTLIHEPTLESVQKLAAESAHDATVEEIEAAYDMVLENWKTQVDEAVLDRYRRSSKIDAVAWEEMCEDVQVIHNRLSDEDIGDRVILDDISEKIFGQCAAQGLSGLALYDAVNGRLPPDRQMKRIGEVERPVKAVLYVPNEDIQSDVQTSRRYVYEAEGPDGKPIQGSIYASGGGDAKRQLAELGLGNARLLIEPGPAIGPDDFDDLLLDDKSAEIAARSTKEGVFASIMRAIVANWWIWAPPTGLVMKTFYDGPPLGWGDYLGFVYAGGALLALVFLIGPMFFYNQLLVAQLKAKPRLARFWIFMLGLTGKFAGITSNQLTIERAKSLAEEGDLGEALDMIADIRAEMTEEEYQAALVSIYSTAGDWSSMMDAQRAYLNETPAKETATVDLALSVARYSEDVESAEPIIQTIRPSDLPEVALIGYQYVRGLIAAHRGQHQQALRHYAQAIETARQFESLPIMVGMIAEINGYAALAYKRSGDAASANKLWMRNLPIIAPHRSSKRLIDAYEHEQPDGD